MPQLSKPLYVIVGIILIINLVLMQRIGQLNSEVQDLGRKLNNQQSSIISISGNVNSSLDRFTREQSWITPVQVNADKTTVADEDGIAVLNWQVKDLPAGAEVMFHYRETETGDFTSLPAENKGAGLFEVSVPFKANIEPFWDIQVSITERMATRISEAKAISVEKFQSVNYYVSMKHDDVLKSSEIGYFDLAYLAQTKYEPISGHVDINGSKYNINLYEHYPSSNNYEYIKAKFYDGSTLVAEKPVDRLNTLSGSRTYYLGYDAESQNISRLIIEVKYTNGKTFSNEIFK